MKQIVWLFSVLLILAGWAIASDVGNSDTTTSRIDNFLNDNGVISRIPGALITEDLTVDSVYVYGDGLISTDWNIVLFQDNSGAPGDTIASTGAFDCVGTSRQYYVRPLSASLTSGNAYFVGVYASGGSNMSKTVKDSTWRVWRDNVFTWPTLPADGSNAAQAGDEDSLKALCSYLVCTAAGGATVYIGIDIQSPEGAGYLQSPSGASAVHKP